jgi:uncharacterized protein (TIGR02145 family)
MAENIDAGTMINSGTPQTDNDTIEKYCYGNSGVNCSIYGGLYSWDELMKYDTTPGSQGICPDGWHVATDEEWKNLEGNVDSLYTVGSMEWDSTGWRGYDAGGNLKETGFNHWNLPNVATNSSGFSIRGAGAFYDGNFGLLKYGAYVWTSSQSGQVPWRRVLIHSRKDILRGTYTKTNCLSVRCVKN